MILYDANSLWRWRPANGDQTGRGTLAEVNIPDSKTWGNGTRALGTFMIDPITGEFAVILRHELLGPQSSPYYQMATTALKH